MILFFGFFVSIASIKSLSPPSMKENEKPIKMGVFFRLNHSCDLFHRTRDIASAVLVSTVMQARRKINHRAQPTRLHTPPEQIARLIGSGKARPLYFAGRSQSQRSIRGFEMYSYTSCTVLSCSISLTAPIII